MYYWFQQRGHVVTDEYLVKWYIFKDSITRNRSDGALVRLVVPIVSAAGEADAERELTRFTGLLTRDLGRYVPD
jgi:EpsI family protein